MQAQAKIQSADLLNRAEQILADMENAYGLSQVESSWSGFLILSHRIHTKLEQGANGDPASVAWWNAIRKKRKEDQVLRYTHHARNADEHGLKPITDREPASIALGVGPGAWQFDGTLGPGGTIRITALGGQVAGESKFVELKPGSVQLVRVVDRGDPYDPPKNTDGTVMTPLEAARATMDHLKTIVAEASALPTH